MDKSVPIGAAKLVVMDGPSTGRYAPAIFSIMNSVAIIINAATVNPMRIEDATLIKGLRFLVGAPSPILKPRYAEIATTARKGAYVLWFGSSAGSAIRYIKQLMVVAEITIIANLKMLVCKVVISASR